MVIQIHSSNTIDLSGTTPYTDLEGQTLLAVVGNRSYLYTCAKGHLHRFLVVHPIRAYSPVYGKPGMHRCFRVTWTMVRVSLKQTRLYGSPLAPPLYSQDPQCVSHTRCNIFGRSFSHWRRGPSPVEGVPGSEAPSWIFCMCMGRFISQLSSDCSVKGTSGTFRTRLSLFLSSTWCSWVALGSCHLGESFMSVGSLCYSPHSSQRWLQLHKFEG